ncbi:type II toxin-antitoxin system Phd/YefM family antitoxin [bacterium]
MVNLNATKARKEFFEIIKDVINTHQIFHIHHKKGDVVLLSEEEYESLNETLELLSIPGFRESIKKSMKQIEKGETYSMDEIFKVSEKGKK